MSTSTLHVSRAGVNLTRTEARESDGASSAEFTALEERVSNLETNGSDSAAVTAAIAEVTASTAALTTSVENLNQTAVQSENVQIITSSPTDISFQTTVDADTVLSDFTEANKPFSFGGLDMTTSLELYVNYGTEYMAPASIYEENGEIFLTDDHTQIDDNTTLSTDANVTVQRFDGDDNDYIMIGSFNTDPGDPDLVAPMGGARSELGISVLQTWITDTFPEKNPGGLSLLQDMYGYYSMNMVAPADKDLRFKLKLRYSLEEDYDGMVILKNGVRTHFFPGTGEAEVTDEISVDVLAGEKLTISLMKDLLYQSPVEYAAFTVLSAEKLDIKTVQKVANLEVDVADARVLTVGDPNLKSFNIVDQFAVIDEQFDTKADASNVAVFEDNIKFDQHNYDSIGLPVVTGSDASLTRAYPMDSGSLAAPDSNLVPVTDVSSTVRVGLGKSDYFQLTPDIDFAIGMIRYNDNTITTMNAYSFADPETNNTYVQLADADDSNTFALRRIAYLKFKNTPAGKLRKIAVNIKALLTPDSTSERLDIFGGDSLLAQSFGLTEMTYEYTTYQSEAEIELRLAKPGNASPDGGVLQFNIISDDLYDITPGKPLHAFNDVVVYNQSGTHSLSELSGLVDALDVRDIYNNVEAIRDNVKATYDQVEANQANIHALVNTDVVDLINKHNQQETALNEKADKTAMTTALADKADKTAVNTALAAKADQTAVTTALAAKADQTAVTTALADKADQTAVNELTNTINSLDVNDIVANVATVRETVTNLTTEVDANVAAIQATVTDITTVVDTNQEKIANILASNVATLIAKDVEIDATLLLKADKSELEATQASVDTKVTLSDDKTGGVYTYGEKTAFIGIDTTNNTFKAIPEYDSSSGYGGRLANTATGDLVVSRYTDTVSLLGDVVQSPFNTYTSGTVLASNLAASFTPTTPVAVGDLTLEFSQSITQDVPYTMVDLKNDGNMWLKIGVEDVTADDANAPTGGGKMFVGIRFTTSVPDTTTYRVYLDTFTSTEPNYDGLKVSVNFDGKYILTGIDQYGSVYVDMKRNDVLYVSFEKDSSDHRGTDTVAFRIASFCRIAPIVKEDKYNIVDNIAEVKSLARNLLSDVAKKAKGVSNIRTYAYDLMEYTASELIDDLSTVIGFEERDNQLLIKKYADNGPGFFDTVPNQAVRMDIDAQWVPYLPNEHIYSYSNTVNLLSMSNTTPMSDVSNVFGFLEQYNPFNSEGQIYTGDAQVEIVPSDVEGESYVAFKAVKDDKRPPLTEKATFIAGETTTKAGAPFSQFSNVHSVRATTAYAFREGVFEVKMAMPAYFKEYFPALWAMETGQPYGVLNAAASPSDYSNLIALSSNVTDENDIKFKYKNVPWSNVEAHEIDIWEEAGDINRTYPFWRDQLPYSNLGWGGQSWEWDLPFPQGINFDHRMNMQIVPGKNDGAVHTFRYERKLYTVDNRPEADVTARLTFSIDGKIYAEYDSQEDKGHFQYILMNIACAGHYAKRQRSGGERIPGYVHPYDENANGTELGRMKIYDIKFHTDDISANMANMREEIASILSA